MFSTIIKFLLSPLNFIRGVTTEIFRQRDKVDFPNSSGLNFLSFSWLTDWILLKSHKDLLDTELPSVDFVDRDLSNVEKLESILDNKTDKCTRFNRLYLAIYTTFWKSFLILILLGMIRDILDFLNVLLLKTILKNMQNETVVDNKLTSGLFTALLCVLQTFDIFFDTHFFFYYYRLEIRIESTLGALISKRAIFNPAENVGNSTMDNLDDGANLLNLQLFDIESASWGALAITDIVLTPIRVIIIASWMYNQVGSASTSTIIVGVITVLMCFLQIKSSSFVKLYLKKLDSRVIETKNVLDNIRTFRLIRWMEYSKEAILTSRTQELQICNKRAYLYAVSHWLGSVLPHIVSLITFIFYLMNKTPDLSLDAAIAIPLMHTITYLIRPLKHLSSHLFYHLSGMASARRIHKYITIRTNTSDTTITSCDTNCNTSGDCKCLNFRERLSSFVNDSASSVCVVLCQPGPNKSKFLSQLETSISELGFECIHTTPTSWLPSGTIRSVILFFHSYNEFVYNGVIGTCGLADDFDSWEDGDLRTIDEGGGSLSTGQRTRIAMARAMYHQNMMDLPFLHVMDNAFSVLDPGLAGQIFSAICNTIKVQTLSNDTPIGVKNGILSTSSFVQPSTILLMDEKQVYQLYQLRPPGFNMLLYDCDLDPVSIDAILALFPDTCKNMGTMTPNGTGGDTGRRKIKNNGVSGTDISTSHLPLLRRYSWYLRHVGFFPLSILIVCTIFSAITHIISDFIIGKWSSESQNGRTYLYLFTLFTSITIICDLCKSLYQAIGTISGAKNTYESSVSGVLYSPMDFYDNMPIGRIINRLSTDQNYVDQSLFHRFCEVTSSLSSIILVLLSLCYLNPTCILIFPFFSLLVYCWVFKHYMGVNKDLMKRKLRKRSPLCTVCNQCIDGESVIRSFKAEKYMYQRYLDALLEYQRMKFIKISSVAWALLRLRALSLPLGFASAVLTPHKNSSDKSLFSLDPTPRVGLALSYSFAFAKLTRHFINTLVQLETEMCCASRLQELSVDSYPPVPVQYGVFTSPHDSLLIEFPPIDFGDIKADNIGDINTSTTGELSRVYRFGLGHYGIVGRTGAGKTTLLNYISGIVPFGGRIELDGVDISLLPEGLMGDIVGVVPREMPMITGWSIRNYVNPMGVHPDYLIYDALRKSGLTYFIKNLNNEDPLDTVIMDKDNNVNPIFTPLIVQHISIARLILHAKSLRIILIDEPIHSNKGQLPQIGSIIKEFLGHCTTLIIAHHVTSLETCKAICLVEQGRIVKSIPKDQLYTQQDLIKLIN